MLKANWAQELIAALANRRVAAGLLMIGFFAILIELHTPGWGLADLSHACAFCSFFGATFCTVRQDGSKS